MKLRSHRNTEGSWPEHSKEGVLESLKYADCIELDLWPCATGTDGKVFSFCIHDGDVYNVTNGSGAITGMSFSQLKDLHMRPRGGSVMSGVRLRTLEENLAEIIKYRASVYLEPKNNTTGHLIAINQALTSVNFPKNRVEFLCWTASPSDIYTYIPSYSGCYLHCVAGGTVTGLSPATIATLKSQGYSGASFWPIEMSAEDWNYSQEQNFPSTYYANGSINYNTWIEANEGAGPFHFLSDVNSLSGQCNDYYTGWKNAHGVSTESGIYDKIFPSGTQYGVNINYYGSGYSRIAKITALPDPSSNRMVFWKYRVEYSDDGSNWFNFPNSGIIQETNATYSLYNDSTIKTQYAINLYGFPNRQLRLATLLK